jgi:DNA-binding CsgD family transcriptional regulator
MTPHARGIAVINRALESVAHRTGTLITVHGVMGTGRTTLLGEIQSLAHERGLLCSRAVASRSELEFELGVLHQLTNTIPSARPDIETQTTDRNETIHPEILKEITDSFTVEPTVLLIDDIQWCDRSSTQWLAYLAKRIEKLPIILVLSRRLGEPIEHNSWLTELIHSSAIHSEIALSDLSDNDALIMLRSLCKTPPTVDIEKEIIHLSGGNPRLIHELAAASQLCARAVCSAPLQHLKHSARSRIAQYLLPALHRSSERALRVARAIAVLGNDAEEHLVASLCDLSAPELAAEVQFLVTMGLATPGEPLALRYPIHADALIHGWTPEDHANAHLKSAQLLSREAGREESVLTHLLAADRFNENWTIDSVLHATETRSVTHYPGMATSALSRVLCETLSPAQRAAVLVRLSRIQANWDIDAAADCLSEAVDLEPSLCSDPLVAADLAQIRFLADRTPHRQLPQPEPGARMTSRTGIDTRFTLLLKTLSNVHAMCLNDRGEHDQHRGNLAATEFNIALSTLIKSARNRETRTSYAILSQVVSEISPIHIKYISFLAGYLLTGIGALELHEVQGTRCRITEAAPRESNLQRFCYQCLVCSAALQQGQLDLSRASGQDAVNAGKELGYSFQGTPLAVALLVRSMLERGDTVEATAALESAVLLGSVPKAVQYAPVLYARAELKLVQHDWDGALDEFRHCGELLSGSGVTTPGALPWRSGMARALIGLGKREQAQEEATEEVRLAQRFAQPKVLGHALCHAGVAIGGVDGEKFIAESVRLLEGTSANLELAKSLGELGKAALRRNRKQAARAHFQRGCGLAAQCCADPLLEELEAELRGMGSKPRRAAYIGLEALTARERRVAELASRGLSNQMIAERLFLARRTVEAHLTSAYRKLNVHGRAGLASVPGLYVAS